ncbi:uncharacterized protein K02A2.6-like [Eupeodes corollae]|uniref:uncharacterized protein K02A2.6-like n=1 Tax=Eupeodes corollae TaxID=290404 RepID=UPI002493A566|nr:uncharacterized protein K02A2.6-like [Eupeodes corollae]
MSTSLDSVVGKLLVQQQEAAERQQHLIEKLTKLMENSSNKASQAPQQQLQAGQQEALMDVIGKSIHEFRYEPENNSTFSHWYGRYEMHFKEDAKTLPDDSKVRLLLRRLSQQVYERYADCILPRKPQELRFEDTVTELKKLFDTKESLFSIRYKCLQITKNDAEDFIAYAGKVNKQCEHFKHAAMSTNQFKCLIFIIGLNSSTYNDIRSKLLTMLDTDAEITLEKLITETQRILIVKSDSHLLEAKDTAINAVSSKKNTRNQFSSNSISDHQKVQHKRIDAPRRPCWQCGAMHFVKDCTYTQHKCNICNKQGHKDGYCACFQKQTQGDSPNTSRPNTAKPKNANNKFNSNKKQAFRQNVIKSSPHSTIHCVGNYTSDRKFVTVEISAKQIKLQFDTAADITIISKTNWIKLGRPNLQPCKRSASDASRNILPLIGMFTTQIRHKNEVKIATVYVTSLPSLNIFRIDLIEKFGYWNLPINSICNAITADMSKDLVLKEVQQKFPDVVSSKTGHCTKFQLRLELKPDSKPVYIPKRDVPYGVADLVEAELKRLENSGIITPITHSDWAAPIVVVRKPNNKIRICPDYSTGLNNCLEPNAHPIPTPDEMFAKTSNCTIFSNIDLSDAYMQFEVDDDSKKLLTMNTHKGLFLMNRLAPGSKPASGLFQRAIEIILQGIDGVAAYLDDIYIATKTLHGNYNVVMEVIKRLNDHGLTINWSKCELFKTSIKYLGHIIDANGIRPDPAKIDSIQRMPRPTNISELRSFLGAVNYYGKFISSMRQLRHPLDEMLKADTSWEWTDKCESAFKKFKEILLSDLLLTHYDPTIPIFVAADASMVGIGAQIFHKMPDGTEKVIYHVSRALTLSEKRYSQIEKEGLALVFACKKFHKMIYGRQFTLLTDHKPLLKIFGSKKGIPTHTANRLQRWALILMSYDFQIQHVSTKEFGNVDVLSRLIDGQKQQIEEDFIVAQIESEIKTILEDNIVHLPVTLNMVRKETSKDTTLLKIFNCIENGWPKSSKNLPLDVIPFFNRHETITIVDNCLMTLDRVIIPAIFQRRILKQLHRGHQGIQRMKSIARSYVYWPKIDTDIENHVKQCQNCASVAKSPTKTELSSWPVPHEPLERIHIDIGGPVRGKYYLVMVDSYSKWPEVAQITTITTTEIINQLHEFVSRYGQPKTIVSDNGTQFTSSNFKRFCDERGIQHIRTPPYHPQSNGQAERFVDIIKRALAKSYTEYSTDDKANLLVFLSQYRATPNPSASEGKSPSDCFIGRKLSTPLDLLKPKTTTDLMKNSSMEEAFNKKHGAIPRYFKAGDKVFAKTFQRNKMFWSSGVIIERIGQVLYNVLIQTNRRNQLIRSHTNQLKQRFTEDMPTVDSYPTNFEPDDIQPTTEDVSTSPNSEATRNPIERNEDELQDSTASRLEELTSPVLRRSTRIRRPPIRLDL